MPGALSNIRYGITSRPRLFGPLVWILAQFAKKLMTWLNSDLQNHMTALSSESSGTILFYFFGLISFWTLVYIVICNLFRLTFFVIIICRCFWSLEALCDYALYKSTFTSACTCSPSAWYPSYTEFAEKSRNIIIRIAYYNSSRRSCSCSLPTRSIPVSSLVELQHVWLVVTAKIYRVGQIKRGQCSFFVVLKHVLQNFDNFWQVKYQFIPYAFWKAK